MNDFTGKDINNIDKAIEANENTKKALKPIFEKGFTAADSVTPVTGPGRVFIPLQMEVIHEAANYDEWKKLMTTINYKLLTGFTHIWLDCNNDFLAGSNDFLKAREAGTFPIRYYRLIRISKL